MSCLTINTERLFYNQYFPLVLILLYFLIWIPCLCIIIWYNFHSSVIKNLCRQFFFGLVASFDLISKFENSVWEGPFLFSAKQIAGAFVLMVSNCFCSYDWCYLNTDNVSSTCQFIIQYYYLSRLFNSILLGCLTFLDCYMVLLF